MLYGQRSLELLYCGSIYLFVKWIQTAFYIDFVVNSNWNELNIMSGSSGKWNAVYWILFSTWSKLHSGDILNSWIQTFYAGDH